MKTSQKQIAAFSLAGGVLLLILAIIAPGGFLAPGSLRSASVSFILGIVFCAIGLFTILRSRRS